MEIGGYIELDKYTLPMLHDGAVALNCARNALWYLCKAKNIKKIVGSKFLCSSVSDVCRRAGVELRYYSINADFMPEAVVPAPGEWIYLVNYYGQLDNEVIARLKDKYERIIVDNAQSYFQPPVLKTDTIYTCRKFFGVSDGAFLYTDKLLEGDIPQDESFERMRFLLGRFERTASEFYGEYVRNNESFSDEPIKKMSSLTENLLHGIDYEKVKQRRTENFRQLHNAFKDINRLELTVPEGAFMYPLYLDNGAIIRKKLQKEKIYIPILWTDVFNICGEGELEYDMAENILPLPVDQRYGRKEMRYLEEKIMKTL